MFEIIQYEFMQNAILAGLLASIACGIIGTLVVVNRFVFISGGIAHATYGGIGFSYYFGIPYMAGVIGFSIFAAFIIAILIAKQKHRIDTIIGVLWAAGMSCGVLLLDLTPGYNINLMSYLFGSILTVSKSDIIIMLVLTLFIFTAVLFFYRHILAISYDAEFAKLRGISVNMINFLLLAMVAVSVVIIMKAVGLILVIALLTIPPYISEKYAKSVSIMMIISAVLCFTFIIIGLGLSYTFNLTSGASIIMVASLAFFISIAK
mmetsp:Transcript_25544/g.12093  ORF Transcript_25544/g.12093 Transcript_25544/m.12093 type:complete len:263 (-) Transcript_25544:90-878(-)